MKKIKLRLNKQNIMITALVAIAVFSLLTAWFYNQSEQRNYEEAGGEIVVIFKDKMTEQGLSYLVDQYDRRVNVVSHIVNYALI